MRPRKIKRGTKPTTDGVPVLTEAMIKEALKRGAVGANELLKELGLNKHKLNLNLRLR